jgi:benzylsuccinate CoA-transferase BbsF subunit
MEKRPFDGLNVLDFTWAGVGPHSVNYLGFYGATIIKVESHNRPDVLRTLAPFKDGIPGIERGYYFAFTQVAKRYNITLNLDHPKGKELIKRLVARCDVVAESWATGAMEKAGLDYESLKAIKPDIIMLRTCMHGHTGPLSKQHGHGFLLTGLSGLDELTGWGDRPPSGLYGAFTDHIAPLFNVIALVAALDYRRRTGKGVYIDQSQHESVLQWVSPVILEYFVNNRETRAHGNRLPHAAPHGIFRCKGDDRWCAIAVFDDSQWKALCETMGQPSLAMDRRFATLLDRKKNEDELDRIVEAWTTQHSEGEVMRLLQAAGIAAGAVATSKDQAEDPQLDHYGFFEEMEHPETGKLRSYHGPLFRLSGTSYEMGRPSLLGEHNDYIYTHLLGMSDEEFVELMQEGVFD